MGDWMGLFVVKYPDGQEDVFYRLEGWSPQKDDLYTTNHGDFYIDRVVHHGGTNYDVWVSPVEPELIEPTDPNRTPPKTEL